MKELNDNEIRVINSATPGRVATHKPRWHRYAIALVAVLIVALPVMWWCVRDSGSSVAEESVYFDSATVESRNVPAMAHARLAADTLVGITVCDTIVNDIPLTLFVPHNLHPSLHVGRLPDAHGDIVMALQAADLRADNLEIVSAFVVNGELLARGTAKQGFCAILGDSLIVGVDDATPYFERTIDEHGDFFRQYPLVADNKVVENRIKNKAQRRALAVIDGTSMVVETATRESMHDFSQALVDLGALTAINLVGSKMTTGWITTADSVVAPQPAATVKTHPLPAKVNYIVWSK